MKYIDLSHEIKNNMPVYPGDIDVKDLGNNFIISSISPDGIIESIEMQNKNFVVGVQWHPEMLALKDDTMLNLFIKFINSCNTK